MCLPDSFPCQILLTEAWRRASCSPRGKSRFVRFDIRHTESACSWDRKKVAIFPKRNSPVNASVTTFTALEQARADPSLLFIGNASASSNTAGTPRRPSRRCHPECPRRCRHVRSATRAHRVTASASAHDERARGVKRPGRGSGGSNRQHQQAALRRV